MNKLIPLLFLIFVPALYANSDHDSRITALEYQVSQLTQQVYKLQAQLNNQNQNSNSAQHMYQCRLSVFTKEYRERSTSRGQAIASIIDQCTDSNDDMFCKPESVECSKY
ncbi:hypothetical protein AB733_21890 [Photobacterium swingsii]|uniref:Uncharacterized protein n=1 Tax=Photobacterium swingsii TaxID=680026 RepID=A0A0J8XTP2_9GAMM|nr:hypothetical protein [Photobacterium swingsii]KMV28709.1 hypothetical protein AB733_21890 [Photobacterium swingsii]PSW26434.1 hypothetical protein C9I94_00020 [Photobacterium swingsii]